MRLRPTPALLATSLWLATGFTLWACRSTLPGPPACSGRQPCEEGQTCVLGRCREEGTMPVSTEATRLIFEPEDLAYVAEGEVRGPNQLDETIRLGKRDAAATLLLRFAVSWPAEDKLQRALLVLDPMPRCALRPGRLELEVAHVTEAWSSASLSLGRLPERSLPMKAGTLGVTPARPLRLDVTEIVRGWDEHKKRYHGLALGAVGSSDSGACFTTGLTQGRGPRLEIYLWPPKGEGGAGGEGGEGGEGGAAGGAGGAEPEAGGGGGAP